MFAVRRSRLCEPASRPVARSVIPRHDEALAVHRCLSQASRGGN
jgi:hypothetical protein